MRREEIGTEDTPLAEIAALLERNQIKRVPITKDGKLVGVGFADDPDHALGYHDAFGADRYAEILVGALEAGCIARCQS
jgi:CBS domain-containing protein